MRLLPVIALLLSGCATSGLIDTMHAADASGCDIERIALTESSQVLEFYRE